MGPESGIETPNFYVHPIGVDLRYAENGIGAYELIPTGVIRSVHVNLEMREEVTDPSLLKWLDEGYLREKAALFGFRKTEGSRYRMQTPSSKRSVYLQKDAYFEDEFGTGYSAVSAKGTGGSLATQKHFSYSDPVGFFGEQHAILEEEVTQLLAHAGARVGRVLGRIVLDPEKLKQWFSDKGVHDKYDPIHNLNRLRSHQEKPAIVVRLEGADRLPDLRYRNHYSLSRTLGRTARLLLREIEGRGGVGAFSDYHQLPDIPTLLDDLESLDQAGRIKVFGNDKKATAEQQATLVTLFHHFTENNYRAAKKVSDEYYGGKLSIKNDPQDNDIAGFWYDFETSDPEYDQYDEPNVHYGFTRPSHPEPNFLNSEVSIDLKEKARIHAKELERE